MENVNQAYFLLKYASLLPSPSTAFVSATFSNMLQTDFGWNSANIWNIQLKYPTFLSKFAILH